MPTERDDISVVKLCCSAMMKGIFEFIDKNEDAIEEIHILDKDLFVLQQFRECAKHLCFEFPKVINFNLSKVKQKLLCIHTCVLSINKFNSLLDNILDWSKLKQIADYVLKSILK